jgi:hypothetical protein
MIVNFDSEGVRKLVDHTRKHPEMSVCMQHMMDKRFWKKGAKPNDYGFVESGDVDTSKIQPYLFLVKDSGAYLMSGSKERLRDGDGNFVVYGKGYEPQADYNKLVKVFGGDDMSVPLPLEWFEKMLEKSGTVKLNVGRKNISLPSMDLGR